MGQPLFPDDASATSDAAMSGCFPDLSTASDMLSTILRPAVLVGGAPFKKGDLIGRRFKVIDLLGSGGMGDVFRVADMQNRGATRALKAIRTRYSSDRAFSDRFSTEVGIALSITHPNVCRVYDCDVDLSAGQPRHFYTMELLKGETLAQYIQTKGAYPRRFFNQLALGLIAGLEAAHNKNVVHRDLKPGNIMLVEDSGHLKPMILDFGLAVNGSDANVVASHDGTLLYMAPEQLAGGKVTKATDIFALGLIFYESLTGERPTGISTLTEYLQKTVQHDNVRAIEKSRVPRLWARIILRCIEKEPSARYGEVGQIREVMEGWQKLPRRLFVGGVAAAAVTTVVALWPRRLKGSYSKIAAADAAFQTGKLHSRRLSAEALLKAVAFFREAIRLDPDFAVAWASLADAYSSLADYGGMSAREALTLAQAAALEATRKGPDIGETHASLAVALSTDPRRWKQAEPSFRRAMNLNPHYGALYQWYAAHLAKLGRTREAIETALRGVAEDPVSLPVNAVLGWMYYYDRQHANAVQQARKTIDLDPNFSYGYIILVRAYTELQRFPEGFAACTDAANHGATRPDGSENPSLHSARGCLLARSGNSPAGLRIAAELEKLSQREPVNPTYLAGVYACCGELDSAFEALSRGIAADKSDVLYLGVYPPLDALRGDPRYTQMLKQVGLADTALKQE